MKWNKEKLSLKQMKSNILNNIGMNQVILVILAGILLLVIALPVKSDSTEENTTKNNSGIGGVSQTNVVGNASANYEEYIEGRVKRILSKIQGAGTVEVMITLKGTSEKVLVSEDSITDNVVRETDSSGGVRESNNYSSEQKYLYEEAADGSSPYVARELTPEIEGVVIIAQGGADAAVAANLTKAAQALLGVEIHKIQVLKMAQ